MSEIYSCGKCRAVFEMPTRYLVDTSSIGADRTELCFPHLPDIKAKNMAREERSKYLSQKYHISQFKTIRPDLSNAIAAMTTNNRAKAGYALEMALTDFAIEKNKGSAQLIVIGPGVTGAGLDRMDNAEYTNMKSCGIFLLSKTSDIKKEFSDIFFARVMGAYSTLVALADTQNPGALSEKMRKSIQSSDDFQKSEIRLLKYCSIVSCHKKIKGDVVKSIDDIYAQILKMQPNEETLLKAVNL